MSKITYREPVTSYTKGGASTQAPKKEVDALFKERAEKIKNSTLYILLDEKEAELNDSLKKAFKRYWSFCKYEFISIGSSKQIADGTYSTFYLTPSAGLNEFGYGINLQTKKDADISGWPVAYVQLYGNAMGVVNGVHAPGKTKEEVLKASIPLTSFFVLRLQQSLNDALNSLPYSTTKIKVETDVDKTVINYVNCDSAVMKGKKIFVLDNIGDEISRAQMIKIFNLPPENISIVSALELNKQLEKQDPSDIFIYDLISNGPLGYSCTGAPLFQFYNDNLMYSGNKYRKKARK